MSTVRLAFVLPPALATDLAILRLTGATIDDRGDHLVVRSPANPAHHWGNFLVVNRPDAVDDAARWVAAFAEQFPAADWVAIGLPAMPQDRAAWRTLGLELEALDVLGAGSLPRQTPPVVGYEVRQLSGPDWDLQLARAIAENATTGRHPATEFAEYAEYRSRQRRSCASNVLPPCSERSGTAPWSPTSASSPAGRSRATRTSAPIRNIAAADWPATCSVWQHSGPPAEAAPNG